MFGVLLRRPRRLSPPPLHRSVRGALHCAAPDALRDRTRVGGPAPEIRHAAHCTAPVTGQLHFRRFLRRNKSCGEHSAVASWGFLAPSLSRAAAAGSSDVFRHELHQRLPLLEDALPAAEVAQMAEWLRATRRAGVRLAAPQSEEKEERNIKGEEHPRVAWRVRDAAPERHQVFDMQERLARLVDAVAERAREEMTRAELNAQSRRQIATAQRMREEIEDDLRWHGVGPQQSTTTTTPVLGNVARIE